MKTDIQLYQTAVYQPEFPSRPAILIVDGIELVASVAKNKMPACHINEILRRLVEEHKKP